MICYSVPSENNPIELKVSVTSKTPVSLILKGYDPNNINSIYFSREVDFFSGTQEFGIPMPLTPKLLKVCAFEKGNKNSRSVSVSYVKAVPLTQTMPPYYNEKDQEYYDFIEEFCKNAGIYSPAIYYSRNKNFEIKLSKKIYNEDGTVSSTPARVFHDHGEIEVSQEKFNEMTVFMRMLILLHEYMHVRLPQVRDPLKEEEKADLAALEVYKALNYPKTEALSSFIKVFRPVNESHEKALIERTDKLFNFLKFN